MSDWFYILGNINIYFKLTAKLKKNRICQLTVTGYIEIIIEWLLQGTMNEKVDTYNFVLSIAGDISSFFFMAFLFVHHTPSICNGLVSTSASLPIPPRPSSFLHIPSLPFTTLKTLLQLPIPGNPPDCHYSSLLSLLCSRKSHSHI